MPTFTRPDNALAVSAFEKMFATSIAPSIDMAQISAEGQAKQASAAKLRPPQVLNYRFAKTGTMEPGFEDTVRLNLSALPEMVEGSLIADVVAVIGSIDIVLGDVDR